MQYILVGTDQNARKIAVLSEEGSAPGLFWLGGFKSDMLGSKAQAISAIGKKHGLGATRFDYSGHGQSGGEFVDGTISDWLEESLAVFEQCTSGPQIVIGSSMGGWLAFLLNKHLRAKGIDRVVALIVIAPALDMTQDLMREKFSPQELEQLETEGRVIQPSDYDEPYILTRKLIEDGASHLLFGHEITTGCPVHILQGAKDDAVPVAHALKLVSHLLLDPVTLTLVPDGDHSLSRKQDLKLLQRAIIQALQSAD